MNSKARHQRQVARESAPLLSQMTRHNVMEVCHQEETFEIGERIGLFLANLPDRDRHQRQVARGSATLYSKQTMEV